MSHVWVLIFPFGGNALVYRTRVNAVKFLCKSGYTVNYIGGVSRKDGVFDVNTPLLFRCEVHS